MNPLRKSAAVLVAALTVLAACGDDDESGDSSPASTAAPAATQASGTEPAGTEPAGTEPNTEPTSTDAAAVNPADLLPDDIREGGVLTIGTSSEWPPFGYLDESGELVGLDIELTTMLAELLDLEPEYSDIDFASLIPGVSSGRFHIAVNQMGDTEERRAEVNFVDYYSSSLAVLQAAGVTGADPSDLCGWRIAVTTGSFQEGVVQDLAETCEADGKEPIEIRTFPDSASTLLAVQGGQAEIFLTSKATGLYTVQTSAKELTVADGIVPNTDAVSGIIVAQDQPDLALALQAALQELIDSGDYQTLLASYDLGSEAVDKATINTGLGL